MYYYYYLFIQIIIIISFILFAISNTILLPVNLLICHLYPIITPIVRFLSILIPYYFRVFHFMVSFLFKGFLELLYIITFILISNFLFLFLFTLIFFYAITYLIIICYLNLKFQLNIENWFPIHFLKIMLTLHYLVLIIIILQFTKLIFLPYLQNLLFIFKFAFSIITILATFILI